MIELLQIKIITAPIGRDRLSSDWDKDEKMDETENEEKKEILSPDESKMLEIHNNKRQEVAKILISRLQSNNLDFELCLNAATIL